MSQGLEGIHICRVRFYTARLLGTQRYHSHLTPIDCPPLSAFNQYLRFVSRSNLPVILLGMAGTQLSVSTAIYTDAVYAVKLASLDLNLGHS